MKTEVIGTRGHSTGDSLEYGVLGHLAYSYGVPTIESKELVAFDFELDFSGIYNVNQQFVPPILDNRTGIDYHYWRCQQFTVSANYVCSYISVPIHKQNQPNGPLYIEIKELNGGGYPTGITLGQIVIQPNDPNIPSAPLMSSPGAQVWTDWYFDNPFIISTGMYGLFMWSTDTNYPAWRWSFAVSLGYPYGAFVYTNNGGLSWNTSPSYDLSFIVHLVGGCVIGLESILEIVSGWEMEVESMIGTTVEIDQSCTSDPGGM